MRKGEFLLAHSCKISSVTVGKSQQQNWGSLSYYIPSWEAESHECRCLALFLQSMEWYPPQLRWVSISANQHSCSFIGMPRDCLLSDSRFCHVGSTIYRSGQGHKACQPFKWCFPWVCLGCQSSSEYLLHVLCSEGRIWQKWILHMPRFHKFFDKNIV